MSSRVSAEAAEPARFETIKASTVASTSVSAAGDDLRYVWRIRLGVALVVLLWALGWYWSSAASMASVWWRSDTFAHGLVVYPITAWLIWRKRADLATVDCRLSLLGMLGVAVGGVAWLLGETANVDAARHFGFVLVVACCVWSVLGSAMAKSIAFPLMFTLLAVPVGEFMLPALVEHTADFTVGALRLTGIPVYREGNNFVVPTGHWSVVEACSGLRYLIASVTLGLLYSYLSYRSVLRRSLFVVASIVVPIIANWVRAYMIVMIGHLSGMKYAVGVDHLLYGWVFFGIVMLLLFWIGSFWREDVQEAAINAPTSSRMRGVSNGSSGVVVAGLLTCSVVVMAPLYAKFLDARSTSSIASLRMPSPSNGWQAATAGALPYRPHYVGALSEIQAGYERSGRSVSLYVAYFADERPGRELISHANGLIGPTEEGWESIGERVRRMEKTGLDTIETDLRSRSAELLVRHWYWVGGSWVRRPEEVKVRQAISRLIGRGDDAAVVVVVTRSVGAQDSAQAALDSFVSDMAPSIRATLQQVRGPRPEGDSPASR